MHLGQTIGLHNTLPYHFYYNNFKIKQRQMRILFDW